MSTREQRAHDLLALKGSQFDLVTRRRMKVPSQYVPGRTYDVTMDRGRAVRGSCPDYKYRRPAGGCKHMRAATRYYALKF